MEPKGAPASRLRLATLSRRLARNMTDMADPTDQPTFGLDRVLQALRLDLLAAQQRASAENAGLTIKDAEVELAFTVEAKTGGGGKINLRVFGVGAGGGLTREKGDSSV